MKTFNRKAGRKPLLFAAGIAAAALLLSACNRTEQADESADPVSQTEYISQDREAVGYYKRVAVAKNGETFEEMKETLGSMKKGVLVLRDDGTAYFDLDGAVTEYTFDKQNFYLLGDTEKSHGAPYTYIGGRLVVRDGAEVTQYLRLTEEELAAYQNGGTNAKGD